MAKTASKAMTRASGVKANKAAPRVTSPDHEHMSVSVRKIDNGYIVSKCTDGPRGYQTEETYSPTKPKIEIPAVKAGRGS